MKKIEMVDLKSQYHKIKNEIDKEILKVVESAAFVKGAKVDDFARELADKLCVRNVIPVANGTDALQISMMALGLKSGDEVLVPAFTFIATAEAAALLGLKPIFVDVDKKTFCIDIDDVKRKITKRTKAILPVHLFGQNCNMERILEIARENDIFVIEDACQSINSKYYFSDGRVSFSGTMGQFGCTSFFPSKNLGCFGDGGAIFTNDDELAKRAKSIANHGMEKRYFHERIGVNSRLDGIQAAVLSVKLKYIDEYTNRRIMLSKMYCSELNSLNSVSLPKCSNQTDHVYHQFTIIAEKRDELKAFLEQKGVPSMIYYPVPLHLQKAFSHDGYKEENCHVSEWLSDNVLSLPMHTEMEDEQAYYICNCIKDFYRN